MLANSYESICLVMNQRNIYVINRSYIKYYIIINTKQTNLLHTQN